MFNSNLIIITKAGVIRQCNSFKGTVNLMLFLFSYSRRQRLIVAVDIRVRLVPGICQRCSLFFLMSPVSSPGSSRDEASSLITPKRNRAMSSRSLSSVRYLLSMEEWPVYPASPPIPRSTGGGQGYNTVGCVSDESVCMLCCLVYRDNIVVYQVVKTLKKCAFKG